jgi:hypothetical protein
MKTRKGTGSKESKQQVTKHSEESPGMGFAFGDVAAQTPSDVLDGQHERTLSSTKGPGTS